MKLDTYLQLKDMFNGTYTDQELAASIIKTMEISPYIDYMFQWNTEKYGVYFHNGFVEMRHMFTKTFTEYYDDIINDYDNRSIFIHEILNYFGNYKFLNQNYWAIHHKKFHSFIKNFADEFKQSDKKANTA